MTIATILLAIFGALLVAAYVLWDLGADRVIASFGRLVVRTITFGRIRIAEDADETTAMRILPRQSWCFSYLLFSSLRACNDGSGKSSCRSAPSR